MSHLDLTAKRFWSLRSGLTRWTEPVGPKVRRVRRSLSHVPWLLSCGFGGRESVLEMGHGESLGPTGSVLKGPLRLWIILGVVYALDFGKLPLLVFDGE